MNYLKANRVVVPTFKVVDWSTCPITLSDVKMRRFNIIDRYEELFLVCA